MRDVPDSSMHALIVYNCQLLLLLDGSSDAGIHVELYFLPAGSHLIISGPVLSAGRYGRYRLRGLISTYTHICTYLMCVEPAPSLCNNPSGLSNQDTYPEYLGTLKRWDRHSMSCTWYLRTPLNVNRFLTETTNVMIINTSLPSFLGRSTFPVSIYI